MNFPAKSHFTNFFFKFEFFRQINFTIFLFYFFEGLVSIKLRLKDQKPMMERLDPIMKKLVTDLKNCAPSEKNDIEVCVFSHNFFSFLLFTFCQLFVYFFSRPKSKLEWKFWAQFIIKLLFNMPICMILQIEWWPKVWKINYFPK